MERSVVLEGGSPWGFRVDGGVDLGRPVTVGKVIPGGKAYHQSLRPGDTVVRINQVDCSNLTNSEAKHLVRSAGQTLALDLHRSSGHLSIPKIQISHKDSNNSDRNTSSISCLLAVNVSGRHMEAKRNSNMLTSSSGSPPERNKSTGSLPNSEVAVSNAEKSPNTKPAIWTPSGKSGVGQSRPYKSVTFSPLSSVMSKSSSQSPGGSTVARSSHTWLPLAPACKPQDTTTTNNISEVVALNGVEVKVPNKDQAKEISAEASKNSDEVTKPLASDFPESSIENRLQLPQSASNLKPVKMSSTAVVWKPPSPGSKPKHPEVSKPDPKLSASVFEWKPVLRNNPVASDFSKDATISSSSGRCSDNTTSSAVPLGDSTSTPLASSSGKTKPNPALSNSRAAPTSLPAVLDCVNLPVSSSPPKRTAPLASANPVPPGRGPVSALEGASSASLGNRAADSSKSQPVDLIDLNSSGDDGKSATAGRRRETVDTTVFEKELSEDWWDSVFDNTSQKDEFLSAAVDAMFANEVAASGAGRSPAVPPPPSSTAAVLHLSSSLGGAIQNASEADREEEAAKKRNALTAAAAAAAAASAARRGQQNSPSGNIINEWRSGFSSHAKEGDHKVWKEYDHFKGCTEQQQKSLEPRLVPKPETPRNRDRSEEEEGSGKPIAESREMREKSKGMSTISGPVPVIFEGIGPMDEKTGVPIATRVSIDEKNRKDWYRRMYASLHKPERRSNPRRLTINGTTETSRRSPTSPEADLLSYYAPHAKYKSQPYRNQPLSIEDYEPGRHSSIALKDNKSDRNRLFESDAEVDYRNGDFECDDEPPAGPRKKGLSSAGTRPKSFDRKQYDDEMRLRKHEIEAVVAEERKRRYTEEQKLNDARRHGDSYTLVQKKSVLFDRFNDYEVGGGPSVLRPKQIKAVKLRGKAKALYPFKAQNNTELSFKKGDIIYLLRKIDRNWYRGEHNGIVGLLPVTYVEVITSLEEAELMAVQREGKAVAKFDFKPKTSAELALRKGDAVMLVRKVDQNWYEGRIGSSKGIFPVSFVETIQEPDTPIVTPSPSVAPTPVPDVPLSPTSSLHSGGPEVPSAPVSPWNSDFYESEFEPELREITMRSLARPPRNRSKSERHSLGDEGGSTSLEAQWKPGGYFTLPAMNKSSNVAAFFGENPAKKDHQSSSQQPKDLFELANRRRGANRESDLASGSSSLAAEGMMEKVRPSKKVEENLGFNAGNEQRGFSKETSSVYSRYLVLYDYEPKNADELKLKEGEYVRVVEKCEDGWYVGFTEAKDEFGTFPGNYVQLVS